MAPRPADKFNELQVLGFNTDHGGNSTFARTKRVTAMARYHPSRMACES